ncbi:MAG: LacI family transcriptional regulator [Bacteroidetes bacterium]|nr:MAG: LacI family transcriptional regulator [Bacteroidota bacterium]
MKKEIITLKKLAQILNLSTSTISRSLNNRPGISQSTKDRVKKAALKFNYTPNIFAQGFRLKKTNIIGVIVPKISHYFTSTVLDGIIEEVESYGYTVLVFESKNNFERQTEMLNTMLQFGVDGILMSLTRETKNIQNILNILERVPLVLFDKVSKKIPCTQIIINDKKSAFDAIEHLINIGKKRIAIFKEAENSFISEQRFQGYLQALESHGFPIDEKLILSTEDISLKQGKRLADIVLALKTKPDAIFAITDSCAIGAIQVLKTHNIKIPEDIAVVGFSNSFSSTIIEPNLTTIDQPGNKIGKIAVKYLMQELERDSKDNFFNKTVEIQTNLIIRGSTFNA